MGNCLEGKVGGGGGRAVDGEDRTPLDMIITYMMTLLFYNG